ncbi:MAG: polyprenyl synthetase family protein [Anaerolineaceae bacterium]
MIKPNTFLNLAQEDLNQVDNLIRSQADGHHSDLGSALDLLLSAGGKRVRPILTIITGKMLGAPNRQLNTLAAAIELLHTATLVHDDLIDGALLRRGAATLNSQWSPGATVLTGDFLFASAAKLAADTECVPVIKLFSKTLTVIVNGEITQLFDRQNPTNLDGYYQRIYAKTASLFETCTTSAAIIGGSDEKTTSDLGRFGREIGMAFQIVDDILDFTADQTTIGKPVGNDLRQGVITLPTILFCQQMPQHPVVQFMKSDGKPENHPGLDALIDEIRSSDVIHDAFQVAQEHVNRGLEIIQAIPESPERLALEDMANYLVDRKL